MSRDRAAGPGPDREDAEPGAGPGPVGARSLVAARYDALGQAMAKRGQSGGAPSASDVATAAVDGASGGAPVDGSVRARVEPRVGADLGGVRVHSDPLAQQASAALGARAFTYGSDVFLGAGESAADAGLMAHELTHVVQQGAAAEQAVQRQIGVGSDSSPAEAEADRVADAVTGNAPPENMVVEDGADLLPGQMHRSQFLRELKERVTETADDALGMMWSAIGCPYIESWFARHATTDAATLERLARRYSGVSRAGTAQGYYAPICARVRQGVESWKAGGDVSADLAAAGAGAGAVDAATRMRDDDGNPIPPGAEGQVQRKPTDAPTAASVVAEMGTSEPLDSGTASRMGDAFGGEDFSNVKVHTGPEASRKVGELDARAVTVGNHIGFGAGEYRPGTVEGDAMLAHELAHTVQQRGAPAEAMRKPLGGESSAHEADADQAAGGVLSRLWGGVKGVFSGAADHAGPALSSGYQLQRCGGTTPEVDWNEDRAERGQNEGQRVGHVGGEHGYAEQPMTAERTIGLYDSQAEAMAAAQSQGGGAVVIPEDGRFAAYTLDHGLLNPTYARTAGLTINAGVTAVIAPDGAVFRPGDLAERGGSSPDAAPAADPFAPYQELADGERGGIANLEEAELLAVFEAAMRDNALAVLLESEREARQKQEQYQRETSGGNGVSDSERDLIVETARRLRDIQDEIDGIQSEIDLRESMPARRRGIGPIRPYPRDTTALEERKQQKLVERSRIRAEYPMLSRYATVTALDAFIAQGPDEQIASLESDATDVLVNIATTRANILNGDLNLWTVPSIVDSTIAGLGLEGNQRDQVKEKAGDQETSETVLSIALAVFSIGFGIAAAAFTGGASLAFAAGAFGLGAYDAIRQTEQHFVTNAATDTDANTEDSMLPPEARQHWGWLVVAWAGVALDFADVIRAADVGAEVAKVAKGSRTIDEAAQALAHGDAELLARLRRAAGQFDIGDEMSADKIQALQGRIGATIEVEPRPPGGGRAGSEVRVEYGLDEHGDVFVRRVVCEAGATVGDVLLHADTVRLMQRYSGLTGKIRELWDLIRSFAGFGDVARCPFPEGSAAWESWHELEKLPRLISVRRAQLDELLADGSRATEAQDALRREIAFLDNEVRIHEGVVRQLAGEASPQGFVAMGEGTRAALENGYRLPNLEHIGPSASPAELDAALRACPYYYRRDGGGFTLVRKAGADAPPLRPEIRDGAPTGRFVPAEATTRAERAAAIVDGWDEGLQEAYETLQALNEGRRVVPVQGVHATGKTIAQLDPGFEEAALEILEPAFRRIYPDDAAMATAKAEEAARAIATHELTVVHGTEHLRAAYGYRSAYIRGLPAGAADDVGEVHHLIPLYLGGDHARLLDLAPHLHDEMHELIEAVRFGDDATLAPRSIQSVVPLQNGAAVVDGTAVTLYRGVRDGEGWRFEEIGGGG